MIIMQMSGGLGNQMFQYAFSMALESRGREVLWDDVTEYPDVEVLENGALVRPKMLEQAFGIRYRRADEERIRTMRDLNMDLSSRIRRKIRGRRAAEFRDEDFCYDPELFENENGYYAGYFQSEKYFYDIKEQVAQAFTFSEKALEDLSKTRAAAERILKEKSPAAVHLRFGDYLTKADLYGGICTDAYYERAVRIILERAPDTVFYIFSNDEALAKEWIARHEKLAPFVLVSGNDEAHGYADLYLMHLCRNFIIANSSFSWWGAWLGKYREGENTGAAVIAPSVWMHFPDGSQLKRADIYTEDMVRINAEGEVVHSPDPEAVPEDEPLVSVIVAAYNIEQYISRALRSLSGQTWKNLEIIVVDDGSTDATGKICDEFAAADKRIRVIHKKNGGLSDARNAGLEIAAGAYIGYLDGDDWADPQMFETMVRACMCAGAEIALAGYRSVDDSKAAENEKGPVPDADNGQKDRQDAGSGEICVRDILRKCTVLDRDEALRAYILSGISTDLTKTPFYNSVWSKLYSRKIVEGQRFPVGKNSEDILYTSKALMAIRTACYIPQALYNYVENRAGSIMNQKLGERRVHDEMPFWQEQIRLLDSQGDKELKRLAQFAYYRRLLYYENEMRGEQALRQYADAMEELLRKDSREVRAVLDASKEQKAGDRARIRLFLCSPGLYRALSTAYEKTWIALHTRSRS